MIGPFGIGSTRSAICLHLRWRCLSRSFFCNYNGVFEDQASSFYLCDAVAVKKDSGLGKRFDATQVSDEIRLFVDRVSSGGVVREARTTLEGSEVRECSKIAEGGCNDNPRFVLGRYPSPVTG